jgi:hypothetical protein
MSEIGYGDGYVQCADCQNLESYWKNGEVAFFVCKTRPVTLKKLESRWRKCKNFNHTNEPAISRRNEIK